MIEIPSVAEFILDTDDAIKFETQTNGDRITMYTHLDEETAATIAYLANRKDGLKISVEIKMLEE